MKCNYWILALLVLVFISCKKDDQFYGRNPFPGILTEEQRNLLNLSKKIMNDTDGLSSNNSSLDLFVIDTIKTTDGMVVDSFEYDFLEANFEINIGDTVLLKNRRIEFTSNSDTTSFELTNAPEDFIYLELAYFKNNEPVNCCIYTSFDYIDTINNKVRIPFGAKISMHSDE